MTAGGITLAPREMAEDDVLDVETDGVKDKDQGNPIALLGEDL